MKYFLFALLFTLIAATLSKEIAGYFQDPDFPGTCFYDGLMLWPDDMGHPNNGKCERVYCLNEEGYAKVLSCRSQTIPTNLQPTDVIKPKTSYPECCEK